MSGNSSPPLGNCLEHMADVVADLLRQDADAILLGEDVADGGMLGLSRHVASDPELSARVVSTPLTPAVVFAHAAGLALGGRRPIVLLHSTTALVEGLAGLREACLLPWRSGHARRVPLLVVAPFGPGFGLGGDASDEIEGLLTRLPGLRVLCASRAQDAGAWLRAAASTAAEDGPTVLLLPRALLVRSLTEPATHELLRDADEVDVVRDGEAVTVFSWGAGVELALQATAAAEVDARVVDVGCLAPLPRESLLRHAKATGRIVIVHGSDRAVAAELSALFADGAILHLDAPVTRIGGAAGPTDDERASFPTLQRLADAIASVASY